MSCTIQKSESERKIIHLSRIYLVSFEALHSCIFIYYLHLNFQNNIYYSYVYYNAVVNILNIL